MNRVSKLLAERARLGRQIAAIDAELAEAYAEKPAPRRRRAPRGIPAGETPPDVERQLEDGLRKAGLS